MTSQPPIAVVTGANRGIGFETCRQLARQGISVVLTSRDPEKGRRAAETLCREGLDVTHHPLDVTDASSIEELARFVEKELGRLDVLVNNAGVTMGPVAVFPRQTADPLVRTDVTTSISGLSLV